MSSSNDTHHETPFDRWMYRVIAVGGVSLLAAFFSALVFALWKTVLGGCQP